MSRAGRLTVRPRSRAGPPRRSGRSAGPTRNPARSSSRRATSARVARSSGSNGSRSASVIAARRAGAGREQRVGEPATAMVAARRRARAGRRRRDATREPDDGRARDGRCDAARRRPAPPPTSAWPAAGSAGAMTRGAERQARPTGRASTSATIVRRSTGLGCRARTRRGLRCASGPTSHGRAPRGAAAARPAAGRPRATARVARSRPTPATSRAPAPRSGRSSNVVGSGACPYSAASAAQRSRHAGSIAVGHVAVRAGEPDEAPHPRHDAVGVVAAATGREPAAAGVAMRDRVDQPSRLAHRGRRHAQVRERVPRVRIGAVLADDEVRPERGGQLGDAAAGPRRATPPRRSRAPAAR